LIADACAGTFGVRQSGGDGRRCGTVSFAVGRSVECHERSTDMIARGLLALSWGRWRCRAAYGEILYREVELE
jgi:hypothetical protein